MKTWFADTSALIKRYVREMGSDWVRSEVARNQVVIANSRLLNSRLREGADFSKATFPDSPSKESN